MIRHEKEDCETFKIILTDVSMNEVIIANHENVFDGPSLFSNRARTMKNLAIIALTTAGTKNGVKLTLDKIMRRQFTIQYDDERREDAVLEINYS
jgi:hypothetical protein